jgi:hypothetical protein
MPKSTNAFVELVYRMPAKPTAGRVTVWRALKKLGVIYLQDSACVIPDLPELREELNRILGKIEDSGGSYHLLPLVRLPPEEEAKLIQLFVQQSEKHYDEIVEDCEVNFVKEIEFEHFRKNYSYAEAEEIRMDFEKISSWLQRVEERDWFGAPNAAEAREWLERCERLLEDFEAKVFEVAERHDDMKEADRPVATESDSESAKRRTGR